MIVDISGIDKVQLLKALWDNRKPAIWFTLHNRSPPPFDHELARDEVKVLIDYFCGRCIKLDLSGDKVDSAMYDKDVGPDEKTVEKIVAKIRNKTLI